MLNSYYRVFNTNNTYILPTNKYKWSGYFPEPMKKALYNKSVKNNHYIICPLYTNGDIQAGVTGGVGVYEKYKDGIIRELGEEIGLVPYNKYNIKFIVNQKIGHKKMSTYISNIVDLHPVEKQWHNVKLLDDEDDSRYKKVGCLVYGTKKRALKFLNTDNIYRYFSHDNIIGIVAVNVKTIKKQFI